MAKGFANGLVHHEVKMLAKTWGIASVLEALLEIVGDAADEVAKEGGDPSLSLAFYRETEQRVAAASRSAHMAGM